MKNRKRAVRAVFPFLAMLLLILDTRTALAGAGEGVRICILTVIPSLFPFFVASGLLTGALLGASVPFLRPLGRLMKIPRGGESLLLVGLLGGYPVGAQCVASACAAGSLEKETARRLLGFCSNAGPAFLFGMAGSLFSSAAPVWALWGIHIASALSVGLLLPGRDSSAAVLPSPGSPSLPAALRQAVRTMAEVCGWVVLFRVILAFCRRWFLWLLPQWAQVLFTGLTELAGGCVDLRLLPGEGLRFLMCAVFLGLGGVCVGMQTVSVTGHLGTGLYFPGKLLQTGVSAALALAAQPLLFSVEERLAIFRPGIPFILVFLTAGILLLRKKEKSSGNLKAVPV